MYVLGKFPHTHMCIDEYIYIYIYIYVYTLGELRRYLYVTPQSRATRHTAYNKFLVKARLVVNKPIQIEQPFQIVRVVLLHCSWSRYWGISSPGLFESQSARAYNFEADGRSRPVSAQNLESPHPLPCKVALYTDIPEPLLSLRMDLSTTAARCSAPVLGGLEQAQCALGLGGGHGIREKVRRGDAAKQIVVLMVHAPP